MAVKPTKKQFSAFFKVEGTIEVPLEGEKLEDALAKARELKSSKVLDDGTWDDFSTTITGIYESC